MDSITEEGGNTVTSVSQEFIELFLGVELVVLTQSGIVVSEVLEDLLVESVSQGRNHIDGASHCSENVCVFCHYISKVVTCT